MLETRDAVPHRRTSTTHPRFRGWWPRAHPDMRSFLGVPIVAPEGVIGAFYLTEKDGGAELHRRRPGADRAARRARGDRDHQRAPVRAEPRAVDRSPSATGSRSSCTTPSARSCSALVLDRRGRRRRCSTATRAAAREQVAKLRGAGARGARRAALARSSSCARPTSSATASAARCASTSRCCGALQRTEIELDARRRARRSTPARDREVLRIAQEALHNALRHAGARRTSPCGCSGDDGSARARGRRRRASASTPTTRSCARASLGPDLDGGAGARGSAARSTIRSAPGAGTTVRLEVADG